MLEIKDRQDYATLVRRDGKKLSPCEDITTEGLLVLAVRLNIASKLIQFGKK